MRITRTEFDRLYDEVATPSIGEAGSLRYLTPDRITAAARLVREGVTVSLGRPLDTERRIDNPTPATYHMTQRPDVHDHDHPVQFAKDFIGVDYHNDGHSHIDALCHVVYRGTIFGGRTSGQDEGTVDTLARGLVGRGVLIDVPRSKGVPWLELGYHVTIEDIEQALQDQNVELTGGDVLLVRTGHTRRLAETSPWDTGRARAGLHPSVALLLARHDVAALGSDSNHDAAPSDVDGIEFPIHVLALHGMGLYLMDYLQFEDLAAQSERLQRWEFLVVVAPLRISGGTGSPVNPIAIL